MKKLMIAMSAAAMAALCAQAAQIGTTEGFEGRDAKQLDVGEDDAGGTTGATYWSRAEGKTGDSVVTAYAEAPAAGNTKFLAVDETDVLTRSAVTSTEVTADTGVAVSTKVRFTAADDAPKAEPGDKILVWAKAPEEGTEGSAKLMVTALGTDESDTETFGKAKAYDTGVTVATGDDDWYDLVITAKKATDADAASPIVFTVKLGETEIDGSYVSLVLTDDEGDKTISSIGFKGTGKVDDIAFNTVADVPPTPVTVTATCTDGIEFDVMAGDDSVLNPKDPENPPVVKVGDTLTIIVAAEKGDTVTAEGLEFEYSESDGYFVAEYTLTPADGEAGAKAFAITVAKGGAPTDKPEIVTAAGQTVEAAVAAANSETGIAVKNCTAADVKISGSSITVGETTVTIPDYYTAGFDAEGSKITLTLNDNALEEETAVTVDEQYLGLTISNSNAKLYYGLATSTTVDAEKYTAPTTLVQGNGEELTLTAEKNGNACFYKLYVTDIAPQTTAE